MKGIRESEREREERLRGDRDGGTYKYVEVNLLRVGRRKHFS